MNSSSLTKLAARGRRITIVLLSCFASGCYLMQAAGGQMAVMAQRRPISEVIASPKTPPEVRGQLNAVRRIRDFASQELKLPDNGSYRQYADIHRPYVVWNVVAAPEFSVQPLQWCFPIAGCVAYRGYFKERDARQFAAEQRARGFDVVTGGVAAYSTLGHFDDPILSTMLGWTDVQLAAIVFHELTHQLLYLPGDSDFNEALATVVEREGVRRWLRASGRDRDLAEFELQESRATQVVGLLSSARARLAEVYRSSLPATQMRERKRLEFAGLQDRYAAMKAPWGPRAPFESWFASPLNNAHLASVATYERCVPGITRELATVAGDLPRFYEIARGLAKLPIAERQARLCDGK